MTRPTDSGSNASGINGIIPHGAWIMRGFSYGLCPDNKSNVAGRNAVDQSIAGGKYGARIKLIATDTLTITNKRIAFLDLALIIILITLFWIILPAGIFRVNFPDITQCSTISFNRINNLAISANI